MCNNEKDMIIIYRIDSYKEVKFDGKNFSSFSSNTGARLHQHMVCKLAEDKLNEK